MNNAEASAVSSEVRWKQIQLFYYRTVMSLVLSHLHEVPNVRLVNIWQVSKMSPVPPAQIRVFSLEAMDDATGYLFPGKTFEAGVGKIKLTLPPSWQFQLECKQSKWNTKSTLQFSIPVEDRSAQNQAEVNAIFGEGTALYDAIVSWCKALRTEIASSAAGYALK